MASGSQWAHAIVACVLLGVALLLPVVFAFATLVVPIVRERRAKWRLRMKRVDVKETDAVVAEPHYCGGFRLAVARGKLGVVKAMTAKWERKGLVRQLNANAYTVRMRMNKAILGRHERNMMYLV